MLNALAMAEATDTDASMSIVNIRDVSLPRHPDFRPIVLHRQQELIQAVQLSTASKPKVPRPILLMLLLMLLILLLIFLLPSSRSRS